MFCMDLCREISKYLLVIECLHMEVAFGKKMYALDDYIMRKKYETYTVIYKKYRLDGFYDKKFKCRLTTNDYHICIVSLCRVKSTKEAVIETAALFRLKL